MEVARVWEISPRVQRINFTGWLCIITMTAAAAAVFIIFLPKMYNIMHALVHGVYFYYYYT